MFNAAPGLIFGENDDVAPDVIWISRERLAIARHVKSIYPRTPKSNAHFEVN